MLVRKAARRPARRSGATLVEMAIVYSALFLILAGLILGSIAVFRYHQVAQLAREGSRWASVHGADWATENTQPPTTPADVYTNAILPRAIDMDTTKLSYAVSWDINQHPYRPYVDPVTNTVKVTNNNVTVTVSYVWDGFLFGPVTLQSTSVSTMHY
jgi:Flp pilus assembly protein TadG